MHAMTITHLGTWVPHATKTSVKQTGKNTHAVYDQWYICSSSSGKGNTSTAGRLLKGNSLLKKSNSNKLMLVNAALPEHRINDIITTLQRIHQTTGHKKERYSV